MDERGAVPARTYSAPVTVDEIFAEEVPLSTDGITEDGNPPAAADKYGREPFEVYAADNPAGADAVALAHQHARQLAGKLARHQHMVALDAAIGLHQAFGQLAALGAPVQAGCRQHGQRQQQGNQ
jgi:hypothetical protein